MRSAIIILAALPLAACAAGSASTAPNAAARPSISIMPAPIPESVTVKAPPESGIAAVIGQRARTLTDRFGPARIDLTEGVARKLQFAGPACVLDVYLYPVAGDTEPVATHVDARLRKTGADTDKAGCIAEIARQ
jgi:hypothetical protein